MEVKTGKRRTYQFENGVHVEISWHHGYKMHMAQIFVPNESGAREYTAFHGRSRLRAFKEARLKLRIDTIPEFRAVMERMNPKTVFGESIVESMKKMRAKLLMNEKNEPPRRLYMNRKMADRFEAGMSVYQKPGQLAGLGMPIVIIDDLLPDNKILKEEDKK